MVQRNLNIGVGFFSPIVCKCASYWERFECENSQFCNLPSLIQVMGCTHICFCVCWWHFWSRFCACLSRSMGMHTPFCRQSTDVAGRHQHSLHPALTAPQDTHRAETTSVLGCVLWMQCSFRFFWHYHRINYYCRMEQVVCTSEQHLFFCKRKNVFPWHWRDQHTPRIVMYFQTKYCWILKDKWDGSVLGWLLLSSVSVRSSL